MDLKIDPASTVPLHKQVELIIREMVEKPEYQHGELLPKETELARVLGINRNTIRWAMSRLVYEGLLYRTRGVGTRAAQKPVVTRLENWHSFSQEMSQQGRPLTNFNLQLEWVRPNGPIREFFGITDDIKVLLLSRLRGNLNMPYVYTESYFHPGIGLTGNEDFTRPLNEILEKDYAVVPAVSKENIKAQRPNKELAAMLGIRIGEPILLRERFVRDAADQPLEYNLAYYRADKFVYSIEIHR